MKFLVGVDAEGMACVVGESGKGLTASKDFEFAKEQATREASAVARGLFAAGAETVVIWDNHGGGLNLDYRAIDERCLILCGTGDRRRMSIIEEEFDGLLLVGYHAMEGTVDGILAHSFSSVTYQWMKVNGREVGEIAIDSSIAGEAGVPTILVASDEAGCREASAFLPWVFTVATKRGLGRNMALSKSPAAVAAELEDTSRAAATALRRQIESDGPTEGGRPAAATPSATQPRPESPAAGSREAGRPPFAPFTFDTPLTYELRFQRADAAEAKARTDRRFVRRDAFTVETEARSITEIY